MTAPGDVPESALSEPGGRLAVRSVLAGAAVNVLISLPAGIMGNALKGGDEGSNSSFLFAAVVLLVGPFVGGIVAARRQRDWPLTHGAAAAGLAWAVLVARSVVSELVGHRPVLLPTFILLGFVSVSVGLFGGYFAFRRDLGRPPPT